LGRQNVSNNSRTANRQNDTKKNARKSIKWDEQNLKDLVEKQRILAATSGKDQLFQNHALQEHLIEQSIFSVTSGGMEVVENSVNPAPSILSALSPLSPSLLGSSSTSSLSSFPKQHPVPHPAVTLSYTRPATIPSHHLHIPLYLQKLNDEIKQKQEKDGGKGKMGRKKMTTLYSCSLTPFYDEMEEYMSDSIAV
jgi:hypothetical protein